MFKNVDNEPILDVVVKCADSLFLQDFWLWDILMCAKGEKGNEIMKEMGAKTINIEDPLVDFPLIVVNGEKIASSKTNLQKIICDKFSVIFRFYIFNLIFFRNFS
jgi:hypothetical protein